MGNALTNKQVWEQVKTETNPASTYEIGVLNTITGFHKTAGEWRFQKGISCEKCRRELTILDYFLTGIQHHSLDGIKKFICPDFQSKSNCNHHIDPELVDRYEIADHANPIICVNCGHLNAMNHKLYSHPGCKGMVIRMPKETYEKFALNCKA